MGCGGSKEEIATGNTVISKSNRSFSRIESEEKASSIPAIDSGASERKEAALISKESPDRYFSSRKEEEAIAIAAAAANVVNRDGDQLMGKNGELEIVAEPPKSHPDEKKSADSGVHSKEKEVASIEGKSSEETVAEKKKLEVK